MQLTIFYCKVNRGCKVVVNYLNDTTCFNLLLCSVCVTKYLSKENLHFYVVILAGRMFQQIYYINVDAQSASRNTRSTVVSVCWLRFIIVIMGGRQKGV